jgi:hypothetical protein
LCTSSIRHTVRRSSSQPFSLLLERDTHSLRRLLGASSIERESGVRARIRQQFGVPEASTSYLGSGSSCGTKQSRPGVRPGDAAPGRGTLPASPEDPSGVRQPLNSYWRCILRELLGGGSPQPGSKDRVCLHACCARLVAEHMVEIIEISVLVRQCLKRRLPDIRNAEPRGQGLVQRTQSGRCGRGVALQNGGCTHQAPQPLPISESMTED